MTLVAGLAMGGSAEPIAVIIAACLTVGATAALLAGHAARTRWERRLHASEKRLRDLAETSNDLLWTLDRDLRYVEVSGNTERLTGRAPGELVGRPLLDGVDPAWRAAGEAVLRGVLKGGALRRQHSRRVHRDGSVLEVTVNAVPIRDEHGDVVGIAGTTTDVTERTRAERRLRDREQRLSEAQRIAGLGSWDLDPISCAFSCSPETLRLFGLDEDARPTWADFLAAIAPEDRDRVVTDALAGLSGSSGIQPEYWIVRPDGERRFVSSRAECERDGDGRLVAVRGTVLDLTERRRAERELDEARERFARAFEHAPIGMAVVALDAARGLRFEQVNAAACRLTGRAEPELVGRWAAEAGLPPADGEASLVARLLEGEISTYRLEKAMIRPHGELRWIALGVSAVRDADGRPLYAVAQMEDVSERREYEQRLQHQADHDALTDLFNRRRFEGEVGRQLAYAARYEEAGAILVLDLDSFKYANDSFGHQAGDAVIRGVADLLRGRLRATDTLARLGGDEFAVMLPRADRAAAERVAEDILEALRSTPIVVDEHTGRVVHMTASLGIALFQRTDMSHNDLLALADMAMYQAKEAGRNAYAVYDADGDHQAIMAERVVLMQRIREALRSDDGFVLYAQPIIDLDSGRATHQEVLLRLRDRDGELISPASFIPVAESFGLMAAVDRWVVRAAIELAARQQAAGEDVRLEINLSGQSLSDPALPDLVETELERHGVDPGRLIFEVTETAAIGNFRHARAFIERLRTVGCSFALDDFGAGYGSFRYLKYLPFDLLKIDGDFIRELPCSPRDQVIVRALVQAAQALGKRTVAEFVSDDATVALLRDWGVDYGQGFHLAEPAPVALQAAAA